MPAGLITTIFLHRRVCLREFGVNVPHMLLAETALHPMTHAMVVENPGTGGKLAGCPLLRLYPMWTRTPTATLNPVTLSRMMYEVSSAPKGIFGDLDLSPPTSSPSSAKWLIFQVHSGCSWNTIHVTDLSKLSPVQVDCLQVLSFTTQR